MEDIAEWLDKAGLAQYAQRFAENDIDVSILPDLTDEDLKELGVSLGHRRHLLSLFAQLREPPLRAQPFVPASIRAERSPSDDDAARRQRHSRFEALPGGKATLVGREEEFGILLRSWEMARKGEGQVLLLSGEAGIGKSRLTAELLVRLAAEPHGRVRYFCSPQHTHSALYPVIGQLERAVGLAQSDPPAVKLDKLDAACAPTATPRDAIALFAELLSIPRDARSPALDLTPHQRRQRTFDALTAQVEALARLQPLLIIFEDAHWADPTSLEALSRFIDRVPLLSALAIVTFRPGFESPWRDWPRVTSLQLRRLAAPDIEAVIDRVAGDRPLPEGLRQDIIERTGGVPLFVEEMTKAVLEAESDRAARKTIATAQPDAVPVPASLHTMLMARLDRLGVAQRWRRPAPPSAASSHRTCWPSSCSSLRQS